MGAQECVEKPEEFVSMFKGSYGVTKRISRRFSALYRLALVAMDLFAIYISLLIGFTLA